MAGLSDPDAIRAVITERQKNALLEGIGARGIEDRLAELGLDEEDLLNDPTMAACVIEDIQSDIMREAMLHR